MYLDTSFRLEKMDTSPRPTIKDRLESAVDEMVSKGIFWTEALAQYEKLFILRVLRQNRGNVSKTADRMGIHRNTLARKLREHGIDRKNR